MLVYPPALSVLAGFSFRIHFSSGAIISLRILLKSAFFTIFLYCSPTVRVIEFKLANRNSSYKKSLDSFVPVIIVIDSSAFAFLVTAAITNEIRM